MKKMVIEELVKAKRSYYIHYNGIKDYELIKKLHESDKSWNISFMCTHLGVSRAAYYKWLNSKPSDRKIEDEKVLNKINN